MTASASARIGYLDCFSGISGDMLLGALLHAGLDEKFLTRELAKLHLQDFNFLAEKKNIHSISAVKVEVSSRRRQEFRTLPTIESLLDQSYLSEEVVSRSKAVFLKLAAAEAKVHGIAIEDVHFHEVGAIDTIIDVVGTAIGLGQLGIRRLVCSSLPISQGFIQCAHGLLPLPAPAVCELLQGVPTYGVDLQQEIITPTGAALIATLADDFGPMPPMAITVTGYGAGSHILANGQPNLLRLIIGEAVQVEENQLIEVIETNLDDWSPEGYPHLCDLLFQNSALDVTLTPIQMKKGRPGFTIQVISPPAHAHQLKDIILSETSAIGLRFRREMRRTLRREQVLVDTPWGKIIAKRVHTPKGIVTYPEYEACRKVAAGNQVPLQTVYDEVRKNGRCR